MKTLLSLMLALSVLAGVAASASAFDSKTFYQEQDRSHY
jgi:type II secretory pathway component PulJ